MKKFVKSLIVTMLVFVIAVSAISCNAPEETPLPEPPLPQPDENPVNVTLADGATTADNTAMLSISGDTVTINTPGTYKFTGSLTNGQIIVDTFNKGDVFLVLSGINVHCENSSPIYCKQAKNLYIVLEKDTQNYVSDGNSYVFEPGLDEPDATVFSKDDLFIMGEGSLIVDANYNDGITGKDDVNIENGNITVDSVNHGIKGKDSLEIKGGVVNINALGDGLKSTQDNDATLGFVEIKGGSITITAGDEGIQAYTQVLIKGGDISVNSAKSGVKSETVITVSGGNLAITSYDDAFSSSKVEGSADANVTFNGNKYSF